MGCADAPTGGRARGCWLSPVVSHGPGGGLRDSRDASLASWGHVKREDSVVQIALDFTPAARELSRVIRRRENAANRILDALRAGPKTTLQLVEVGGVRFGARILELRQAGHRIKTEDRLDYAVYSLEGE
jgi:hypothetical protein